MPRVSAFRGTWVQNRRPYVVLAPDLYVSIQGETSVVGCGECRRRVNLNKYVTSVSSEGTVDSPPGSATVTMSIPDNDVNEFYVDGQLIIIPMMEIELFAKGYFTVGGFPQYYRIFWGLVSSVNKIWNNGVTTVTLSCRDILMWWELTNVILQPGFLEANKSAAGWNLFQNRFSGANPYVVIMTLAREAMGDFSLTTGSFMSFKPEQGGEQEVIAPYAKDIMTYWQLKFGNIWNNLVLYGTSGQSYTFAGSPGTMSILQISQAIFEQEKDNLSLNPETAEFKIQPHEIAAFKIEISKAGDVEFFQNEIQSKLAVAMTARDQAGAYEFYCDTTGDIIFKPPFFNLNVMPNKPVSWIQDFEIIDDNIQDTEQPVVTHVTASGNAFGGVTDWGLNDEITTPHTGVMDWHLLKRYGWRRIDLQLEWAGNMRKVFYHLLDHMDKVNSKRHNGTITIPLRPELRMGFPVWIPRYDSFYYVQGISHNYSPGGQATTALQLTAKRSKFIAPKNIGRIYKTGSRTITDEAREGDKVIKTETRTVDTYGIEFPSSVGDTAGLGNQVQGGKRFDEPAILRDVKTGKLLGFPNAVMCFRTTLSGNKLGQILRQKGSKKGHKPKTQDKKTTEGTTYSYSKVVNAALVELQNASRAQLIDRLKAHRYEAGMTNAGAYDYAHDEDGVFKEFSIIPSDHILWGTGTTDPDKGTEAAGEPHGSQTAEEKSKEEARVKEILKRLEEERKPLNKALNDATKEANQAARDFTKYERETYKGSKAPPENEYTEADKQKKQIQKDAEAKVAAAKKDLDAKDAEIREIKLNQGAIRRLPAINTMVRPVSDEFGFEVIGHYRYGRGIFIDRGQMQIPDPATIANNPRIANKLNVQFAAHGGLLTDNPKDSGLGLESATFAEAFERMQPDDYVTGASFKGANYSGGSDVRDVNPTGQRTYTDSINNAVTKSGRAVFAEADALRRSITLAELKPTLDGFPQDVQFEKCSCSLNRTDWLSVLPQSFLREVLSPNTSSDRKETTAETRANEAAAQAAEYAKTAEKAAEDALNTLAASGDEEDAGLTELLQAEAEKARSEAELARAEAEQTKADAEAAAVNQANSSIVQPSGDFVSGPGGFFEVLRRYLTERFQTDYDGDNMHRERYAIGGGEPRYVPDTDNLQTPNLFGKPGGSLFDRAALGDPKALEALKGDINFSFGGTEKAYENFLDEMDRIGDEAEQKFGDNLESMVEKSTHGLVTIELDNPPTTDEPGPKLGIIANPGVVTGNLTDGDLGLDFEEEESEESIQFEQIPTED